MFGYFPALRSLTPQNKPSMLRAYGESIRFYTRAKGKDLGEDQKQHGLRAGLSCLRTARPSRHGRWVCYDPAALECLDERPKVRPPECCVGLHKVWTHNVFQFGGVRIFGLDRPRCKETFGRFPFPIEIAQWMIIQLSSQGRKAAKALACSIHLPDSHFLCTLSCLST